VSNCTQLSTERCPECISGEVIDVEIDKYILCAYVAGNCRNQGLPEMSGVS